MSNDKNFTIWELACAFGITAIALAITQILHFSHLWQSAVAWTTALFIIVVMMMRELWKAKFFWRNYFILLAIHIFFLYPAINALPRDWTSVPFFISYPFVLAEAILIMVVLKKRTISKTDN